MNSYTLPAPLEPVRLRSALAKTLQLYPAHAGAIARHPESGTWQLHLTNNSVQLSIGQTREPGPFGPNWGGERHKGRYPSFFSELYLIVLDTDYYDELPRGNVTRCANLRLPLFQAKVTTWVETGQTSIMVSQSYSLGEFVRHYHLRGTPVLTHHNLGDAFTILSFMHCWSSFYQGKQPPLTPTFEKYHIPDLPVQPSASLASDLERISFMAADFDEEYFEERLHRMEEATERLDITFCGDFVDRVWKATKRMTDSSRISRGDAFAGYLISILQSILDEPVNYAHQLVTVCQTNNYPSITVHV